MALPESTPEQRQLLELWQGRVKFSEKDHKAFRERAERLYANYRSYKNFKEYVSGGPERDRDSRFQEGEGEWGADYFIPYTFATIETQAPRILSNRPKMLVLPRGKASERNVEKMKFTIDAQQADIDYELVLQDVVKTALIYNLGVQKSYWKREKKKYLQRVQRMVPDQHGPAGEWYLAEVERTLFDGPTAEAVDPFDFFWDPYAHDLDGCDYVVHRTWRSTKYVLDKMKSGVWAPVTPEELKGLSGGTTKFADLHQRRREVAGMPASPVPGEVDIDLSERHAIWECHDGDTVTHILDGEWVLAHGRNPLGYRGVPFQIYRPIKVPNSFVGIGAAEPIMDLQEEMNTLRRQRRDKATISINMPFAFAEGSIDPDNFRFAPNLGIPVGGLVDPREVLFPLTTPDVPASGYEEEARLAQDIERTTGLSDSLQGGQATAETATGAQLQVAAANIRIQLMTLRAEKEVAKPTCCSWVAMNQKEITESRQVRGEPYPMEEGDTLPRYRWYDIGPAELQGEFIIEPDGGSVAPTNIPQEQQTAQYLKNLLGQDPNIDQRTLTRAVLEKLGVKQIDGWLTADQTIPPQFLEVLGQAGVPGELIQQTLEIAQQMDQEQRQAPPQMPNRPPEAAPSTA